MFNLYAVGRCKISDWLDKFDMSQAELSRRTGISPSSINEYIHNISKPDIKNARNIACVFSCNIEDLYEWYWKPVEKD